MGVEKDIVSYLNNTKHEYENELHNTQNKLSALIKGDDGHFGYDSDLLHLRHSEELLSAQYGAIITQLNLLNVIIPVIQGIADGGLKVVVPKYVDTYLKKQVAKPSYRGQPALLLQDTFVGFGSDDLPAKIIDFIDDNPETIIRAIMDGYTVENGK